MHWVMEPDRRGWVICGELKYMTFELIIIVTRTIQCSNLNKLVINVIITK